MPHSSSKHPLWATSVTHSPACTAVVRKLITLLTDKYGLPAHALAGPDESNLTHAAATLDFLANNLPPRAEALSKTPDTRDQQPECELSVR